MVATDKETISLWVHKTNVVMVVEAVNVKYLVLVNRCFLLFCVFVCLWWWCLTLGLFRLLENNESGLKLVKHSAWSNKVVVGVVSICVGRGNSLDENVPFAVENIPSFTLALGYSVGYT